MIVGTNTWNGIAYGNERYAVVGDSGYVNSSSRWGYMGKLQKL